MAINYKNNSANKAARETVEANTRQRETSTFTGSANDPFNAPKRDNYQTYPYDYFSGADCKIFFGDIWVDDIITIEYNVNQSKTPIYGYASQVFDAVAKGQVIVQGTLSVAFKETGYLNIIQGIIESQRKNARAAVQRKLSDTRVAADVGMAKFVPRITTLGEDPTPEKTGLSYSSNGTPQIIRQQQTIEDILMSKKAGTALSSQIIGEGNDKNRDFEDFAELLEDTIWGDSNGEPFKLKNKLKRVDEFDYNENGGILTAKNKSYSDVLNIMLTFGDINDFRAEHTLVVLNDVHFVSSSMVVSPNGDPLAEVYTFFAREINEAISSEIEKNMNPIKLNIGNNDIKLSKLEDISTIEEWLDKKPNQQLFISIEAAFDDSGWSPYPGELELNFNPNKITPFTDQLCEAVERAMNDIRVPEVVDSSMEQYIVTILDAGPGNAPINVTMILEQGVPGTRSYRVISPTRTGFAAPTLFTRDDLMTDVSALPPPLDVLSTSISRDKNRIEASIAQAGYEKLRIDEQLTLLGTEDERARLENLEKYQNELLDTIAIRGLDEEYTKLINDTSIQVEVARQALRLEENRDIDSRSFTSDAEARKLELELERQRLSESEDKLSNKFKNFEEREHLIGVEKQKIATRAAEELAKIEKKKEEAAARAEAARLEAVENDRIQNEVTKATTADLEAELKRLDEEFSKEYQMRANSEKRPKPLWSPLGNKVTTSVFGEAITSSEYSHQYDPSIHAGNYTFKRAVDIGNISSAGTLGYVRSPFGGTVQASYYDSVKGEGAATILTDNGLTITYAHLSQEQTKKFVPNYPLKQGENIHYSRDHLHVQGSKDQLAEGQLESVVRENLGGIGYRDTHPTQGGQTPAEKQQSVVQEYRPKFDQPVVQDTNFVEPTKPATPVPVAPVTPTNTSAAKESTKSVQVSTPVLPIQPVKIKESDPKLVAQVKEVIPTEYNKLDAILLATATATKARKSVDAAVVGKVKKQYYKNIQPLVASNPNISTLPKAEQNMIITKAYFEAANTNVQAKKDFETYLKSVGLKQSDYNTLIYNALQQLNK